MSQSKAIIQPALVERVREFVTPLNLHFAGIAALVLFNLYLLIHIAFSWQVTRSQDATALAQQNTQLQAAEVAARPLRGLDDKLVKATASADKFYGRRLPYAYSQVIAELGALAKKQGIKLAGVQYAQSAILDGSVGAVTEVRMDARLTGEYRPLVLFINTLERDRMFFYISSVTLTGQQSGTVNLRLKVNTYLRGPVADEGSSTAVPAETAPSTPATAGEGPQ